MISNFRLLKTLTLVTASISVLAFTRVSSSGSEFNAGYSDTLSPSPVIVPPSPNVQVGEQSFPFLGSAISYQVYVPENYSSTAYRYPVVYILNGPVFSPDPKLEKANDWLVDELLDSLAAKGKQKCLVVALSGLPDAAGNEDSLVSFLSEQVKPFIDSAYRTQAAQSVVAGTGTFADAALLTSLTHPREFPRAGVFSPTDSLNSLLESRGLTGAGFSGMIFIYKNGSRQSGILADNLAARSSALLYTRNRQHSKRPVTPLGGWFSEFFCWVTGNGFNYIINTRNQ